MDPLIGCSKYLGVKFVDAKPMSRGEYNIFRGWDLPKGEDSEDAGYLVIYSDGYMSWCPKQQFEEANRHSTGLTFGYALEAMKRGRKVRRRGWNGKGIYVYFMQDVYGAPRTKGETYRTPIADHIAINTEGLQTDNPDAPKSVVPWLASQTDMLAEDWEIVEN